MIDYEEMVYREISQAGHFGGCDEIDVAVRTTLKLAFAERVVARLIEQGRVYRTRGIITRLRICEEKA